MKTPVGFLELCQGLHQDALYLAQGSVERLAADCVEFVRQDHKADLREFLRGELGERTASELKGAINRQKPDIRLSSRTSKSSWKCSSALGLRDDRIFLSFAVISAAKPGNSVARRERWLDAITEINAGRVEEIVPGRTVGKWRAF